MPSAPYRHGMMDIINYGYICPVRLGINFLLNLPLIMCELIASTASIIVEACPKL